MSDLYALLGDGVGMCLLPPVFAGEKGEIHGVWGYFGFSLRWEGVGSVEAKNL